MYSVGVLYFLLVFLLGLSVGSFLNVLIDRLANGESIWLGRSHCDWCKKPLRWYELIPVLSFIIQRGRCRRCHKKISLQYPLVELAAGTIFVTQPWASWIILSALLVIFVADLKYMIIPDSMIVVGLLGVVTRGNWLAALVAAIFFLILFLLTRGKGMGFGDVKLAFLLGFWLGFPHVVIALYLAFLTGAVTGVTLILTGKKGLKSKIAFGPFLVLGAVLTYLYSSWILAWWEGIL